ncbi:MAG: ATP-binding protein [Candidatus Omnitrophota bacterium]|jgi:signal transduction histidine kinase
MNNFAISTLLTSLTTLFLALFVFIKNPKAKLNRIFALYSFSISIWSFFVSIHGFTRNQETSIFAAHALHIGAAFIPVTFVHFVLVFLNDMITPLKKWLLRLMYFIACVSVAAGFTSLFVKNVTPRHNVLYLMTPGGIWYHLFVFYFAACVAYGLLRLFLEYIHSKGLRHNQMKYLFWSSLFGFIGGVNNFLIIYDLDIFPLNPYGTYAVPVYVCVATYAIIKYRLMDIKVAITRTGIFVLVYTFVLGIPFAVALLAKYWLIGIFNLNWWAIPLILMAVLATVGPFIYIYLERKAEGRILKEQKRYQNTLKQASIGITRIRNLAKLFDLITHIITKTVRISFAAIYLFNTEEQEFTLQVCRDKKRALAKKISSKNPLLTWINKTRQPLVYEEVKRKMQDFNEPVYKALEENMNLLSAAVIIPSFLENKLLGFIVLGDKLSGQIYTLEDLNVFQILASQAALAIENAQFYEDAKNMQEQIAQAEKMATIGTMADGLSHQINNRFYALSLIAGDTIDTIKITDASNCSPEIKVMLGQINHALERIQFNVIQGGEVVKGILKYTRKGNEGFEALTMDQIIDGTLAMVQYKVKLADFDLIREYPLDLAKIKGNLVQLEEVFFNFIDNAYDAIVERRTTLQEEGYRGKITIRAQEQDAIMRIEIQDNGMGVKEENFKKLFTPFFTTKVSSRRGTGLGLYVINKIITDTHTGKIFIESQHTIGTKFIVELPLFKAIQPVL